MDYWQVVRDKKPEEILKRWGFSKVYWFDHNPGLISAFMCSNGGNWRYGHVSLSTPKSIYVSVDKEYQGLTGEIASLQFLIDLKSTSIANTLETVRRLNNELVSLTEMKSEAQRNL